MSVTIVTTHRLLDNVEFTNDIQAEMIMLNLSLWGIWVINYPSNVVGIYRIFFLNFYADAAVPQN